MEIKPLSPWQYFGLEILYNIPIVGFVFLLIHAIGAQNVNKKNFARAHFCLLLLVVIVIVIVVAISGGTAIFSNILEAIKG